MKNKKLAIGLIVLVIVILFIVLRDDTSMPVAKEALVYYNPVQCMGNPWEKDWISKNGNDPGKYPKEQDNDIVKAYYSALGVSVREVKSETTQPIVCAACSCSRGDTLSLLIAHDDVETMRDLGFELEKPAADGE